jgi:hypothetical protein
MPNHLLPLLAAALALGTTVPAHAVGQRVDVQIVDRATGEALTPILHDGAWWVAGKPGARYRVAIVNRDGQRTLNVLSVDGINAISGETAAWSQTGYVLDAYDRTGIDGWRKNVDEVAAFEFAALPDSYAARTGRPGNVGVIGVAVFDERRTIVPANKVADKVADATGPVRRLAAPTGAPAESGDAPQPAPPATARADSSTPASTSEPADSRERLGTAHGAIEQSTIRYVAFRRAQSTPNEIVTIHYDRLENLVAMGIVGRPMPPIAANPFPDSGFVPDPPPRR